MPSYKQLEWKTVQTFHEVITARNDVAGRHSGEYQICASEKYGGFNIYGLQKNPDKGYIPTGWAETVEEAKRIAQEDYTQRQRLEAWRQYMIAHDPPEEPDVVSR